VQQKGSCRKDVLAELKKFRAQDQHYTDGRILCSMCTKPHPIAKKAYELFFDTNLGDQGLFPATAQIEHEVVAQLGSILHKEDAAGFVVSGGTEANLLALLVARNTANIAYPEVVLPESIHFSFTKNCSLLNLKPVYASLDEQFKVKASAVEKLVNKKTIAIVGTAGTAELGAVDPISELSEIALRHQVHLHVDAAFGGLVLPFLTSRIKFDFQLDGVKSLTVDPHKMGMAAIPAGGILFKNPQMIDSLKTETPYLSDKAQYTFVGTRTGASAASAWAVFKKLGFEGFRKVVGGCMKNTNFLAEGIKEAGFSLLCKPSLNIISFQGKNTKNLADNLWRKGWFVSYIPRYDCIRIVVMPHLKRKNAWAFLKTLKEMEKL
jgi:tyrosine decarboxylase / aspartate 1-decarboxylase